MPVKKIKKTISATKPAAAPSADLPAGSYSGYCVKCKEKNVEYKGKVEVSKTGMNMAKGPCPTCGTTICRILGKAATA